NILEEKEFIEFRNQFGRNDIVIPIDTLEFIDFFEQFRYAILNNDSTCLYSLVRDSLNSDCFLSIPDEYKKVSPCLNGGKISKYDLYNQLGGLFSISFYQLLQEYDVRKDLYQKDHSQTNPYSCKFRKGNKTYYSSTSVGSFFIPDDKNSFIYTMGVIEEIDYESPFYILLRFTKLDSKIFLNEILCIKSIGVA
ncbi:hypothetical protein LJB92_04430, partial [Bacteroidales bacterium OttesenSCG-928-M06]|nr:hypothetical protein [Bacteroidales bacterium OttesenSCG-928-M06]